LAGLKKIWRIFRTSDFSPSPNAQKYRQLERPVFVSDPSSRGPDREVWMAFFDDTEGNTLALMAEPRICDGGK
jgi:hypothetical protein